MENEVMKMPKTGRQWADVKTDLLERGNGDAKWREGKTAVYVFNAGDEIAAIQKEAYSAYMSENGLGPAAFPSLAQMEADVISMALDLLHGPAGSTGAMTSGGTDSITMAIKTARDFARTNGRALDSANIVLPQSAHLAFDKASYLKAVSEASKTRNMFKNAFKVGKMISKPIIRAVSPFIPVVGTAGTLMGVADVAEAAKRDLRNEELGIAYLAGPDVAENYSKFKESVRGKSDEFEEFVP